MDTTENYCSSQLQIIPQFSGTCWFNSILTVMLYSDNFKRYLKSHFKSMTSHPKYDKLFKFLLYMTKYHNKIEKLEQVYKSFTNFKLKPEYLLFSYLNKYDPVIKEYMKKKLKNNVDIGLNPIYICHILNTYNIPFINFIKYRDNLYIDLNLNKSKNNINITINDDYNHRNYLNEKANTTDIIIVNHNYSDIYELTDIPDYKQIDNRTLYKSIYNIEKEIIINSNVFELDSCIIMNSYGSLINTKDSFLTWHAISGITCGKNQFLVDSKDTFQLKDDTEIVNEYNKLLKYDWYKNLISNYTISVTYDRATKKQSINTISNPTLLLIANASTNKQQYNIENSKILFIYIKKKDSRSISLDSLPTIDIKDLELSSKEISKNIKSYYDIYNLSTDELFHKLKKIYHLNDTTYPISYFQNVKDKFNYVFKKHFNMEIDTTMSDDDLLKILFRNLIIHYIKYGKLLKFTLDEIVINECINKFIRYHNNELKNYINTNYKLDVLPNNIDKFSNILFINNPKYYDKYLIREETTRDNYKKLLIRIILDNIILNEDYITKYYITSLNSLSISDLYKEIESYKEFKYDLLKRNIDIYFNILFKHNFKYYDIELSHTVEERVKKTLIRILLDKIIFNNNNISLFRIYTLNIESTVENLIEKLKKINSSIFDVSKIDEYLKLLFNDNPKYYDKDIIKMVSDKTKQVLIELE